MREGGKEWMDGLAARMAKIFMWVEEGDQWRLDGVVAQRACQQKKKKRKASG
jgi:hypothetical protein